MTELSGILFPIQLTDKFSANFAKFEDSIAKAKAAIESLRAAKNGLASGTAVVVKKFGDDLRAEAEAAKTDVAGSSRASRKKVSDTKAETVAKKLLLKVDKESLELTKEAAKLGATGKGSRADLTAARKTRQEREKDIATLKKQREERKKGYEEGIKFFNKLESNAKTRQRTEEKSLKTSEKQAESFRKARLEAVSFFSSLDKNRSLAAAAANQRQFIALKSIFTTNFDDQITAPKKQAEILAAKRAAALRDEQKALAAAAKETKRLGDVQAQTTRTGNSLFFTFRRLVGVFAIFAIARNAVQGFQGLVREGVRFNSTVESSRLGIAALVSSSAELFDNFGRSVTGAEALDRALKLSSIQINKLKKDARETVASFADLVQTFQVATAPGLAQGFNLDQIRQLTKLISQGASALDIPQNQLSEEIRSLLSGTIQQRTTRIAAALGITNEDIRRAKEANNLFGFLNQRLAAFDDAGKRIGTTTRGAFNRLVQVLQEILGEGFEPLNKAIRDTSNELYELFQQGPARERLVNVFRDIADVLKTALEAAINLARNGFGLLEQSIGTIKNIANGALTGLSVSLSVIARLASLAAQGLELMLAPLRLFGVTSEGVSAIAAALLVFQRAGGPIVNTLGVMLGLFTKLGKVLAGPIAYGITALIALISTPVGAAVAALGGLTAAGFALAGAFSGAEERVRAVSDLTEDLKKDIQTLEKEIEALEKNIQKPRRVVPPDTVDLTRYTGRQVLPPTPPPNRDRQILDFKKKILELEKQRIESLSKIERADEAVLKSLERESDVQEKINALQEQRISPEQIRAGEIRIRLAGQHRDEVEKLNRQYDDTVKALAQANKLIQEGSQKVAGIDFFSSLSGEKDVTQRLEALKKIEIGTANRTALEKRLTDLKAEQKVLDDAINRAGDAQVKNLDIQIKKQRELADERRLAENKATVFRASASQGTRREQLQADLAAQIAEQQQLAREAARTGDEGALQQALSTIELIKAAKAEIENTPILLFNTNETLKQFADIESNFDNFLSGAIQSVTGSLGDAFVNALGGGNSDEIEQIFRNLGLSLAKNLAEVGLQKLLTLFLGSGSTNLGLLSGLFGGGAGGATGGHVSSGKIGSGNRRGPIGLAHYSKAAMGFAKGGMPRPKWVDKRDTIPAWLRPGEFIVRPEATKIFRPLLEYINSFGVRGGAMKPPPMPSYAGGGFVAPREIPVETRASRSENIRLVIDQPVTVYDRHQAEDLRKSRAGRTLLKDISPSRKDRSEESF